MSDARRVGSFFSGLLLYGISVGGASMLSVYHLPRELVRRLGGRDSTAVIALESLLIALLVFALALCWSTLSLKPPRRKGRRPITSWFFSGILAAWLGGLLYGVFYFALNPQAYPTSAQLLLASDVPPLWGALNTLAVVVASMIGGRLARWLNPPPTRSSRSSRHAAPPPPKTLIA